MKVLLAVSGGIDSMYMANRASEFFPGACFAVAHCNFSLRGADSDGDETFVLPKGRKVRMTKLDATQDMICIEITDGVKGWFRLRDGMNYSDYFSGLYFAG